MPGPEIREKSCLWAPVKGNFGIPGTSYNDHSDQVHWAVG